MRRVMSLFFRLLYHEFAWTYDLVAAVVSLGMWKRWVFSVLPYLEGARVLELGYGPGHLQAALAHRDVSAAGVDESRQMAGQVVQRMRKLGFPFRVVNGYAQFLPFSTGCFNQVVATFPSDYIFHSDTLAEIRRVLVPGGSLVILPFAWITGRGFLYRLAAGLFRLTGEAPDLGSDWGSAFLEPFRRAGFDSRLEHHTLPNSRLVIILAQKPHL